MGKSNQINMNSKVDENKYEDEDVVVVTSIITPTITTSNTTIRQQDHLRSLHIISRWDANYTKKRYTNTHIVSRWDANYTKKRYINTNNNNVYVDRPPISPVRTRTRKPHRITVAPGA